MNIAILASGSGTNAENIIHYTRKNPGVVTVSLIICNRPDAGVIGRAERLGVECLVFSSEEMHLGVRPIQVMQRCQIDLVVLAGYLNLISEPYFQAFPRRILNLHPALLPLYGGKGMYGHHVHEAVIAHGEKRTGITIHLVDEQYDHGTTLCQATCPVLPNDTPDTLAERIHRLEYAYYPVVVEQYAAELQGR